MTIDQVYRFVNFIYNKKQNGYITPEQFNDLAPIMQMSFINDRLGNVRKYRPHDPVPAYGFGMNQKTREELRPLLVKPTTTAVTSGVAVIPSDFLYYDTVTAAGKLVPEVTEDQITDLNNSLIRPPTAVYPKMVVHSNGLNIYPDTITSIKLSYVRIPATPLWNYTMVNDEAVYAATGGIIGGGNSQNFETSPGTHLEIANMLLSAFGVNLGLSEVVEYAEMGIQQGK